MAAKKLLQALSVPFATDAAAGEGEHLAYLVMELVEGEALSELLARERRLPVGPTLDRRTKPDAVVADSRVDFTDGLITSGSSNVAAQVAGGSGISAGARG